MATDDASSVVDALIEMGFPPVKCEEAVRVTGTGGVQVAMDWILSHNEEVGTTTEAQATISDNTTVTQPKSLKCEDCGKILKSELDAQAHAARTSHQNFAESTEEIKPLSAEEKEAQLARLEEKLKQKRIAREEKEKTDNREREKLRRKSGKELTEVKQRMELAEIKKLAEERKREKAEDRLARQRVKEQIAKDRAEREAIKSKPIPVANNTQPTTTANSKVYTTCKLQIRLLDGTSTVKTLQATDTLQAVVTQLGSANTQLMTNFPKRVFCDADLERTLQELGLVPSAVLIQTTKRD